MTKSAAYNIILQSAYGMIIAINKLLAKAQYEGEFSFEYEAPQTLVSVPLCRFDGAVSVYGKYEIYDDSSVGIDLRLRYTLKGQCSYCLGDAQKRVDYASEILFVTDKDDGDDYVYDGRNIDLTEAVDDALLFSQPAVLLCKEGCQGIKIN